MRGSFGVVALVMACSAPSAPPARAPAAPAEPPAPEAPYDVQPSELGDAGAVQRIRHRVRVRHFGLAYLQHDGASIGDDSDREDEHDDVLPVLEESGTRIQVAVEDDGARFAMWIDRRDTWPTLRRRTRLDPTTEPLPPGDAGAWLEAGASLTLLEQGPRSAIRLRDEVVAVRGWVDGARLGRIWVIPVGDPTPHDMVRQSFRSDSAWTPPEGEAANLLGANQPVRLAPSETSPIVANTRRSVGCAVLGVRGSWSEVELHRPYVRVRGFVPTRVLAPYEMLGHISGTSGGYGIGMSHADRIVVPVGTCLYDGADGDVVGVEIVEATRYGHLRTSTPGWSVVYASSPWGMVQFHVRDVGNDPAQPRWQACGASATSP